VDALKGELSQAILRESALLLGAEYVKSIYLQLFLNKK
jgi:hypothetical protein